MIGGGGDLPRRPSVLGLKRAVTRGNKWREPLPVMLRWLKRQPWRRAARLNVIDEGEIAQNELCQLAKPSQELAEAVGILAEARVPVSIYNHQYCVLPFGLRELARQSISDWKNEYIDECR